jgi:hypothetical protein
MVTVLFQDPAEGRPAALTITVLRPDLSRIVLQSPAGPAPDGTEASLSAARTHALKDWEHDRNIHRSEARHAAVPDLGVQVTLRSRATAGAPPPGSTGRDPIKRAKAAESQARRRGWRACRQQRKL